MKNKEVISELTDKLKDLDYFIFAGFAIYLYTNGEREFKDIDLLIKYEDLKKLAGRIGGKIKRRKIKKGDFITEDCFLETNFKGQEVEAISIIPENKNDEKSFEKQLSNRVEKEFFGKKVYLTPIEGILVHKSIVNREKDVCDLKMLKKFHKKINLDLLKEIDRLRGKHDKVFRVLKEIGYNVK